jgi:hypothetical protein
MSVRALVTLTLIAGLLVGACARERGEEPARNSGSRRPFRFNRPTPTQTAPAGTAPTGTTTATSTSTAPTATATGTATTPPPSGTIPPPISPTDLIKFQDACWKNCDQYACMKIAEAYRTGSGLPQDVLAGRRYAVHACQECGTPSIAVSADCPTWGLK